MIKETYKMEIEIEYEFDENEITPIDAMDVIDYFATAKVELDDVRVNILNATLTPKD